MRVTPLLTVRDVEQTSRWYQQLLGWSSGHGGPDFEMLLDGGEVVLLLHRLDADHLQPGVVAGDARGNGSILYLNLGDDLPQAVQRVRKAGATLLKGPSYNDLAHQEELWIRDPDGYVLCLTGAADWGP